MLFYESSKLNVDFDIFLGISKQEAGPVQTNATFV